MRIAVFIKRTTFHKDSGGMETQNKVLCEALVKKGHAVTVFSPCWELEKGTKTFSGVTYVLVESVYKTLFSKVSKKNWFFASARAFSSLHAQNSFDLILSQSSAGLGLVRTKNSHKLPVISISHGSMMSEIQTRVRNFKGIKGLIQLIPDLIFGVHIFFGRQREFIHGSDKVICVSEFVKSCLIDEAFAPESKFVVIHNGVYLESSHESGESPELGTKPSLLYVGRLEKEKGTNVIALLFKDPQFADLKIDIIGTGPEEAFLKRVSVRNGNHTVHGRVSHEDVLKQYTPNKIFIFPTNRLEGFPMVLIEAMFGGCAPVAFDLGGVSDAIENNKTGILVAPGKIGQFKDKLDMLLTDPALRVRFGEMSKQKAQREFTVGTMVDAYLSVMSEVMKK